MQIPVSQQPVVEKPAVNQFDAFRWQTADEAAWKLVDTRKKLTRAKAFFDDAISLARSANINDYRCGSSLAGKATACYWIVKSKLYGSSKSQQFVDPTSEYSSILSVAQSALQCFQIGDVPRKYLRRLAQLNYLIGILNTQLCLGTQAESSFRSAAIQFQALDLNEDRAKALHLIAKILLCRRQLVEAIQIFSEIDGLTNKPETKLAALLDFVNTLVWIGKPRLASQFLPQISTWLNRLEDGQPASLTNRFRATLLFAKVYLEIGKTSEAETEIQIARTMLECQPNEISKLGRNVYFVIAARVAIANREFLKAERCLLNFDLNIEYPTKGFSELEIIAIDAGCRQCLTECICTCMRLECDCCCPNVCRSVCFTENVTTPVDFDFKSLFAAFTKSTMGRIQLVQGEFVSAATNLENAVSDISAAIHYDSPVKLDDTLGLLCAKREQNDQSGFGKLVNESIRLSKITRQDSKHDISSLPPSHPTWIDLYSISGFWRLDLGSYEVAKLDFDRTIETAVALRSITHEKSIQAHLGQAETWIGLGEIDHANAAIDDAQSLLKSTGVCDQGTAQTICLLRAMICTLGRCFSSGRRAFERIDNEWIRLMSEENYAESNRMPGRLWLLIAKIEEHEGQGDFNSDYNVWTNLARVKTGKLNVMIAFQLNRVALLLRSNRLYDSAHYLYSRAIEIYALCGMPEFQRQVEENRRQLEEKLGERSRK